MNRIRGKKREKVREIERGESEKNGRERERGGRE